MGFTLARFQYLDISGTFRLSVTPGEWYWYQQGFRHVGIILHLGAVLPLSFLVCFQFVPVIRHKLLLLHRIDGYIIILLTFASNAGALMITRHAQGGAPATQAGLAVLAIITTFGITMAYYNIKRLQIDQHRAWMLRTFIIMGSIITTRPIMILGRSIITNMGSYYSDMPCAEIRHTYEQFGAVGPSNPTNLIYPQCADPSSSGQIAVLVSNAGPEGIGAGLNLTFGMGLWLAMFLHAFFVELYLSLTPAEAQRLRIVSYKRQREAGFKNPGSAGFTVEKWGDAPRWEPPAEVVAEYEAEKRRIGGGGGDV
ncbi:MAG: hypothetical protein Q9187_006018 [Circinaria calcarea]